MLGAGKNNQYLGVDIGESAIKLVQMTRNNTHTLSHIAIEPLHRGLLVDGQIVDAEQIGSCIRDTLARYHFTAKQAIACVSFADIISRRLMVPADLRGSEIEQWIELEVDKFVPFSVLELNLDYQFSEGYAATARQEVLVTACRRNTVDKIQSCLEFAELDPLCIDVAHNALERASKVQTTRMAGAELRALVGLVDIGTSSTRLYVYAGESLVYQREEPFGARILVDDIAAEYSMAEDRAVQALYDQNLPPSYKTRVLKPCIRLLLKDIEHAIRAFEASEVDGQISCVLLAGGAARVGGLAGVLQNRIQLEVQPLHALALLRTGKIVEAKSVYAQAPQLALACGLAMWARDATA